MELSFATLKNKNVKLIKFPLHDHITKQINETFGIYGNNKFTFLFSNFVEFDIRHHGAALKYVLDEDSKHIKELKKDQLLFVCAVLDHVGLKSYFDTTVKMLIKKYKMKYSDIHIYITSKKLSMTIL